MNFDIDLFRSKEIPVTKTLSYQIEIQMKLDEHLEVNDVMLYT